MSEVRDRTLEVLDEIDLNVAEDERLRDGFVYEMVLAHEHQHNETMLQLLQMIPGHEPPARDPAPASETPSAGPEMVAVSACAHDIGAHDRGFAYDNERPRHERELTPFHIDRTPVTNGAFAAFVEDTGAGPPLYWEADGSGGWVSTVFGGAEPVDPDLPVVHVDHAQATAFAEWAGKRLPTEFEWEAAATAADPERANLDGLAFGPAPAGAYADAPSDSGAVQMLGDVWEWTSSELEPYPGFRAFPYREYSQVFFGTGMKVLRGGSWATRRSVIRTSFRNWDLPQRRQIFSGFRCAADA